MKLLIVDDDIATVDEILTSVDWRSLGIDAVDYAYSAAQAKKTLASGDVDIVISDIEMPQGSGLELLKWVRDKGLQIEFLLLTCHERFDYAASALKLNAAEYLTKPFDAKLMAISVKKTVAKIMENRRLREASVYGEWLSQNQPREELSFWLSLLGGVAARDIEQLKREIEARSLKLSATASYRLVAARVYEYERAEREIGRELLFFTLESTFSRCLCGREDNRRVVRRVGVNGLWLSAAIDNEPEAPIKERCADAIRACADIARLKVTCCIGDAAPMCELGAKLTTLQGLIERNVTFYGMPFYESEAAANDDEASVLDIAALEDMLRAHDKAGALNALKAALSGRETARRLTERTLYIARQELLQATYAYMAKSGAQAAPMFNDEASVRLSDLACRSSLDMLRFASHILELAFAREDDINKSASLTQRIDAYLREHYREDVGRAELSAEFFLAPEYLSKLYKKRTGRTIKDSLREYRVAEAKRLLRDPDTLVGDVAARVGYDNFSYFTTIFKKETGVTPQEYRRKSGLTDDTDELRP